MAPVGETPSLGRYLRALRSDAGGSLLDMAGATRISEGHLRALESDALRELPAPVFVKGFIRAYCAFLGAPAIAADLESGVAHAMLARPIRRADLVIGVGAGSVIQGARIVTILLAEKRPVEELVTQYPEHGPAISPKLMEPKLPIINVLTAPTGTDSMAP